MAVTGLHGLVYTSEPEKVRVMLRDVFGFNHVDAGGGWLIFTMPPAELGVHPKEPEGGEGHLLSFMCDDINGTIAGLRAKGVTVTDGPKDQSYGITAMLNLPGNCDMMIYEPRHPVAAGKAAKKKAKKTAARKTASPRPGRRGKKAGRRR